MAFKGALKEFDIASVFQFVQGHQQSGNLELLGDEGRWGTFTFSNGEMVLVSSSENTLNRVVLQYLLAKGQVDDKAMRELLAASRKDLSQLIQMCLDHNYFEEEELSRVLQDGLMDLACDLFTWQSGTYEFVPRTEEGPSIHPSLTIRPEFVTMEAMRRIDESVPLREEFRPEMILKMNENAFGGREIQVEGHSPLKHPAVHLLFLMNGEHTVADLLKKSFLSEFRLYEVLSKLLKRGFVDVMTYTEAQEKSLQEKSGLTDERESAVAGSPGERGSSRSTLIVFGVLLLLITARLFFVPDLPMLGFHIDPLSEDNAKRKQRIAEIQYEAETGVEALNPYLLKKQGRFLKSRDLRE